MHNKKLKKQKKSLAKLFHLSMKNISISSPKKCMIRRGEERGERREERGEKRSEK
jgi:hypothetical protein